ncbi:MAG: hypothetical protein KAY24_11020 [Candidatus Eisenbacteria sp.]|nr:hypothetical protein [Candidatus Eisenbacteria bacterium]
MRMRDLLRDLTAAIGWLLLACLFAPPAAADLPLFSAGMGSGIGGLFHEEHVSGAPQASGIGRYSSAAWYADLAWSFRSRLTVGVRAHLLRVPLEEDEQLGTMDLFPVVVQIGYYCPGLTGRLRGFVAGGVGVAWTRFLSSSRSSQWESYEREGLEVSISENHPLVLEATLGANLELTSDFLVEMGLTSVLMDTEVSYRPASDSGTSEFLQPSYAYSVEGRHLLLTLGLRWWFEWW